MICEIIVAGSNGLMRYAAAPRDIARAIAAGWGCAVRKMIGMWRGGGAAFLGLPHLHTRVCGWTQS